MTHVVGDKVSELAAAARGEVRAIRKIFVGEIRADGVAIDPSIPPKLFVGGENEIVSRAFHRG